ncbi:hypothetical protein BASA60_000788 [Batrachochytrium salamandrivorans]|nr:hypothetical protein BASA60_000788 [Batrachochytrium salamandrivorans]
MLQCSVMLVAICSIFTNYILHSIDLQNETPWEEKPIYFFLCGTDCCIPFHIVRDLYMTLCSFIRRCGDLIKYHRATANMDQRYSNATATELATMDRVCIIRRGEMVAVPGNAPLAEAVCIAARAAVGAVDAGSVAHRINPNTPKRLPCGKSQVPDQPAIVNPVAAVNPIATNVNDNMPQLDGAVHPHQYPQALPAANASWWS